MYLGQNLDVIGVVVAWRGVHTGRLYKRAAFPALNDRRTCTSLPSGTSAHSLISPLFNFTRPAFMSTQVATTTLTNGVNGVNGASKKIKSKNQLRRLKAKQKKAEEKDKPVRLPLNACRFMSLTGV